MTADELFDLLDDDRDGRLSRADLYRAATRLGWHWREAPLYAVLDNLTVREPLSRTALAECLAQMAADPYGPYGKVLCRSPACAPGLAATRPSLARPDAPPSAEAPGEAARGAGLLAVLADHAGEEVADRYRALTEDSAARHAALDVEHAALLLIDPQRSFARGVWMRSAGAGAARQVAPIRAAFARCGQLLREQGDRVATMLTRCPFPPDSYDWDPDVAGPLAPDQLYFVKPGNSALWPPTNGYRDWLDRLADRGLRHLVMGGCTLNSCVRVSAIESHLYAEPRGLAIVVDLSLCGARLANYAPSHEFDGRSSVEAAVREMRAAGVRVVAGVDWQPARASPDVER